jgi:prepilin-type N-terminal cleavage/methylation domain-containing protein
MRSAFTLIEVLVATVIATVVGAGLLQLNSNYTYLFSKIKDKSLSSEIVSIIGLHADVKYNKTTKSLYDILDKTYDIKNDDLRKYLKDTSFDYRETLVDTITFGEDGSESEEEFSMGDSQETSAVAPVIQFELIDVSIKNRDLQGSILQIRLIEL